MPQTFRAATLENLRLKRKWSRFEVVLKVAQSSKDGHTITPDTLGRWERGETTPGADDLARVAAVFGVRVEAFYD